MSFFHWGLHAWATYGVMGLELAYFGFRYNLPLTLRSGLYPVLREGVNGWIGHTVDAFALVGTVAGIAVTLGYGVLQLSAGLHTIAGWQTDTDTFRIGLVAVVVALAGLSAASGLDKGVRRLSELNLMLAFALLAFVVVAGPTSFLLRAIGDNIGEYLSKLVSLSFRTYAYEVPNDKGWFAGWTLLYWAWWVSWSPFVGMFIARISRGRTIRQFVIGVLLVPTAFNLVWMTAFGISAIWLDTHAAAGALAQTATNVDALLFRFFDYLPLTQLLSVAAIVLIAVFFVTSADSGAFVIDAIATRGAPQSPVWQRLFWAAVLGVTASVLLVAGGLKALQALTLVAALPVALVMLALCYGLWRGLKADHAHYSQAMAPATSFWTGQHWRHRLSQILRHTSDADARQFIAQTVEPALRKVADELQAGGVRAPLEIDPRLREIDFGAWEMQSWDAIGRDALDRWSADLMHAREHGGESAAQFVARVRPAFATLAVAARTSWVLTHAGVIRALASHALDAPLDAMLARPIAMGGIVWLRCDEGGDSDCARGWRIAHGDD